MTMKRSLIALALAGLLANVAFAEPTLTGDDTIDQVHLSGWRNAPESTSYTTDSFKAKFTSKEIVGTENNTYGQYGVYEFNP